MENLGLIYVFALAKGACISGLQHSERSITEVSTKIYAQRSNSKGSDPVFERQTCRQKSKPFLGETEPSSRWIVRASFQAGLARDLDAEVPAPHTVDVHFLCFLVAGYYTKFLDGHGQSKHTLGIVCMH